MNFFDTHAHYNDEVYHDDLEKVLNECKKIGVQYIVNAAYDLKSSREAIVLSNKYDYIYASIGIHPQDIQKNNIDELYDIYNKQNNGKIVAIGEIGLDYAYGNDNKKEQILGFEKQIEIAKTLQLPIIIHSRDASLDTYNVIKKIDNNQKVLFHCFQPSDDLVRLVLDRGYMVAFGGNITYKRNESFKRYIESIPMKQIVIETDSPYLSPVPFRGKRNSSVNLNIICEKLAEYKNTDKEEIADITFNNAINFFKIK